MKTIVLLILLMTSQWTFAQTTCLSEGEKQLYDLIMAYRKTKKLGPIPYSEKLTRVAQAHVRDLTDYFDKDNDTGCNPHSWSKNGNWKPCCYTSDHKEAECMWTKPKEIAGYTGEGYEIAFYSSAGAQPFESLEGWKQSAGHNPLLINSGIWQKVQWKAIGIGIYRNYSVVWFGATEDSSAIRNCDN